VKLHAEDLNGKQQEQRKEKYKKENLMLIKLADIG
jgi:hypothetical protein